MSKYRVLILEQAEQDLVWLKKNDRKNYVKCFDLLRDISIAPRSSIGKPERLRYFSESEVYSRRVNQKDHLIYTVYEADKEVDISSCRSHYGD